MYDLLCDALNVGERHEPVAYMDALYSGGYIV